MAAIFYLPVKLFFKITLCTSSFEETAGEASTAENTTDYVSLAFRPFDKFPARILLLFFVIVAVHTFISVSPGSPVSILFLMQL